MHIDTSPPRSHAMGPDVVPEAGDRGRQAGVVPPAVRATTNYEIVDATEAMRRAAARARGEMPLIAGGLDGPGQEKQARMPAPMPTARTQPQPVTEDTPEPLDDYLSELDRDDAEVPTRAEDSPGFNPGGINPVQYSKKASAPEQPQAAVEQDLFSIEVSNDLGSMEFRAAAVSYTETAVIIVTRSAPMFQPKLGARLSLSVSGLGSAVYATEVFVPSREFRVLLDSKPLSVLVFLKTE